MKLKYFIWANIMVLIVAGIWVLLETVIYGAPEPRLVDDIVILVMYPCFYITAVWLDEKLSKPKNYTITIEVPNEGD